MKRHTLKVDKRTETGKKVRRLRKQGLVPATIYGKDISSVSVQLPLKDFVTTFKQVGQTGLVDLQVEKETLPSLIKFVQSHPVSGLVLHVEFHKVNLKEKISAQVPVELVGESIAQKDGVGLLLQNLNEIEVEALPANLPEKIEINVEKLATVDEQITVADLAKIPDVEFVSPFEEVIVKVVPAVSQEAQKEAEAEAAASEAAKTEGETATPEAAETPAGGSETKSE